MLKKIQTEKKDHGILKLTLILSDSLFYCFWRKIDATLISYFKNDHSLREKAGLLGVMYGAENFPLMLGAMAQRPIEAFSIEKPIFFWSVFHVVESLKRKSLQNVIML